MADGMALLQTSLPKFLLGLGACSILFWLWMLRGTKACKGKRAGSVRIPIHQVIRDATAGVKYECQDLHAPRLTGYSLKFLSWLGNTRLFGGLITSHIISSSGLDILAGEYIPEPPTYYPSPPPPSSSEKPSSLISSNAAILKNLVESFLKSESKTDFRYTTIADFYNAYKTGLCTPMGVAKAVIDAIKHSNSGSPPLKAIVDYDSRVIEAMAAASTSRWQNGKPLSYFDGVPVAVKGEFGVEPYQLRGGAIFIPVSSFGIPEAQVVSKLKSAGAIIIGISNLQEFGTGTHGSNCHKSYLTARNPHNPEHYCGGSSSGSAASVAAGLCPLAIGSDGGGSVRIPAGVCGVVGLKPTNQLLKEPGVLPVAFTVSTLGPLCSSVLDIAMSMNVFLEEKEQHRFSLDELKQVFSLKEEGKLPLEGFKVGIYTEYFQHADPEIVKPCQEAVSLLKELGAEVKEIVIPELEEMRVAHLISIAAEFANALAVDLDKHYWKFAPETLLPVKAGLHFSSLEYINAQKQRTRGIEIMKSIFEEVDVVATPTVACLPPKVLPSALHCGMSDAENAGRFMRFAFIANLTGIPGLALPVGRSQSGLPISFQLMAPWHEEGRLIAMGWALEDRIPSFRAPNVSYDLINN